MQGLKEEMDIDIESIVLLQRWHPLLFHDCQEVQPTQEVGRKRCKGASGKEMVEWVGSVCGRDMFLFHSEEEVCWHTYYEDTNVQLIFPPLDSSPPSHPTPHPTSSVTIVTFMNCWSPLTLKWMSYTSIWVCHRSSQMVHSPATKIFCKHISSFKSCTHTLLLEQSQL